MTLNESAIQCARYRYQSNTIDMDDEPQTMPAADNSGIWVQAWVFVPMEDIEDKNNPVNITVTGEGLMKTEYTQDDIDRGWLWYKVHSDHVDRLVRNCRHCYPMSGSDIGHPELWKDGGWVWFFAAYNDKRV